MKARNARRYTPGTDYQLIHAARLNAISQRLLSRMTDSESTEDTDSKDAQEGQDRDVVQSGE